MKHLTIFPNQAAYDAELLAGAPNILFPNVSYLTAEDKIVTIPVPSLLPRVFTVSDSGKKVRFSKGNLFWNGFKFKLEEHQYDYPTSWNASHVGHFKWGSTAADAIAADTSTPSGSTFFAADGGVFEGFTVLSIDEWEYLMDNALAKSSSSKNNITIDGKDCLVLKPDGFSGTVADSYSTAEWVEAEKSGLLALPFAGYRYGSSFSRVGSNDNYWSSTPDDSGGAWSMDGVYKVHDLGRNFGFSVRLVKVVQG